MVDPGRLKEAAAFERIRLFASLIFHKKVLTLDQMDDLKGLPDKRTVKGNLHPK